MTMINRLFFRLGIVASGSMITSWLLLCNACGSYPAGLVTADDIRRAPSTTERISIPFLPIEDYPLLEKFYNLKAVDFYAIDGTGGNDEKLEALARLNFRSLYDIGLLNCPFVTDAGILSLSSIGTLKYLQLEGTSITDSAAKVIADNMGLLGVNVANCELISINGLRSLSRSESLIELGFSLGGLKESAVIDLISEFKTIQWCLIVDPEERLDESIIASFARERGVQVVIAKTGALEDVRTGPNRN